MRTLKGNYGSYQGFNRPKTQSSKQSFGFLEGSRSVVKLNLIRFAEWPGDPNATSKNEQQGGTLSKLNCLVNDQIAMNIFLLEPSGPSSLIAGNDKRISAGTYQLIKNPGSSGDFRLVLLNQSEAKVSFGSRSLINIHIANYPREIEGCLAPGISANTKDKSPSVNHSGTAYKALKKIIIDNSKTQKVTAYDGANIYHKALHYQDVTLTIEDKIEAKKPTFIKTEDTRLNLVPSKPITFQRLLDEYLMDFEKKCDDVWGYGHSSFDKLNWDLRRLYYEGVLWDIVIMDNGHYITRGQHFESSITEKSAPFFNAYDSWNKTDRKIKSRSIKKGESSAAYLLSNQEVLHTFPNDLRPRALDFGHVVAGVDAFLHPHNFKDIFGTGVELNIHHNYEQATWLGDLGSAHAELGFFSENRSDVDEISLMTPQLVSQAYEIAQPPADLLGNVCSYLFVQHYGLKELRRNDESPSFLYKDFFFSEPNEVPILKNKFTNFGALIGLYFDPTTDDFVSTDKFKQTYVDPVIVSSRLFRKSETMTVKGAVAEVAWEKLTRDKATKLEIYNSNLILEKFIEHMRILISKEFKR